MHCLNHPRREAAARCTSCGEVFCRECVTDFQGRMVCGECYRQKSALKEEARRDWFWLSVTLQMALGLGTLWLLAWLVGRMLVDMPSSFHEGTLWESLGR